MPASIELPDVARAQSVASIKRYLAEELELDVGELKAGLMLDFILKEVAPTVYNTAIGDAQAFIRDRVADLDGACTVVEFGYWPSSSARRKG